MKHTEPERGPITEAELDRILGNDITAADDPLPPGQARIHDDEPARRDFTQHFTLIALIAAALGALMVALGLLGGVGPAAPTPAHAAERAAMFTGNSDTAWVGPQAVTVSIAVAGNSYGLLHPCIRNNGPDRIRILTNAVHDYAAGWRKYGKRLRYSGGTLRPGQMSCDTSGHAHAYHSWWTVVLKDTRTGAVGSTTIRVAA